MVVNTNVSVLNGLEYSKQNSKELTTSLEKLSSGLKINKAADDASGLAIADKLRTQVTSINQGVDNGNSALALLQIADKSMAEQSNILDTIKAKLIQANADTTSPDGKKAIAAEIAKQLEQLNNIAKQTNYNGTTLLQASQTSQSAVDPLTFQVGENSEDIISTVKVQANTAGYGLADLLSAAKGATTASLADAAFTVGASGTLAGFQDDVDAALTTLNGYRGDLGASQNQIDSAIANLMTQSTNIANAESVIRDVDYAEESANFSKLNIISQAGTYAISQATTTQQNVLRLLQ